MKEKNKIFFCLLILVSFLLWIINGFSYGKSNIANIENKYFGKVSPEQLITIYYKGNFYNIPAGYIIGYGPHNSRGRNTQFNLYGVNILKELNFYYIMPKKRYFEKDEDCDREIYQQCLSGKPQIQSDETSEYIVEAHLRELRQADSGALTPEVLCKKIQLIQGSEETLAFEKKYDLVKFYHTDTDVNSTDDNYCSEKGAVPEVYMNCSRLERVPNPTCIAEQYYPKTDLYIRMTIPTGYIEQWSENVAAVDKFLEDWHVKEPAEIEHLNQLLQTQ